MNAASFVYPIIIIVCLYLIYANVRNTLKYKKENIETLFVLNEDDKTKRLTTLTIMILMILATAYLLFSIITQDAISKKEAIMPFILLILFVILYVPISKKTQITSLGIMKSSILTRWEAIKGINYAKPDDKGRIKVKVLYKSLYNTETFLNITFKKDDEQVEQFKNVVKEYRNYKKKCKKSEK